MTHLLPPNLLRLFTPRPPLPYVKPLESDRDPCSKPSSKKIQPLEGVAAFLERVKQEAADNGVATEEGDADEESFTLSEQTKREIRREEKKRKIEERFKKGVEEYDPKQDAEAVGDPFKTLFISRLSYEVTEDDLRREFNMYGPIERIRIVRDKNGKSRGYAFIVYDKERDMRTAYKDAEGIKILGRRILVDVERGRTVKDWKPMRLGGGLGGLTRKPKVAPVVEDPAFAGGFGGRGGFRGGFRGGGGGGFRGGGFRGGRGGGFAPRGGFGGSPRGGGGFGGPPRGGFGGPRGGYGGPPSGGFGGGGYGGGGDGPGSGANAGYGGGQGYGARGPPGGGGYGGGGSNGFGGGGGGGGGYGGGYDDGPPAKRGRY